MTYLRFKKFNIEAYKPGKSSVKKLKKIIKLSANESALGMSSRVKRVISKKNFNFFRYPDGKSKVLRKESQDLNSEISPVLSANFFVGTSTALRIEVNKLAKGIFLSSSKE